MDYNVRVKNILGGDKMKIDSARVDLCLADQGMTRSQLAERSGVARTNLSVILSRGTCNSATLGKIARGLGVPAAEIVGSAEEGGGRSSA